MTNAPMNSSASGHDHRSVFEETRARSVDATVMFRSCGLCVLSVLAILLFPLTGDTQPSFEDVTSDLQHVDPAVRRRAMRALREAGYPEAAESVAALLTDEVEDVRLEAIETELSFFLIDAVPARRRVALVIELWGQGGAQAAFDAGPRVVAPLAVPSAVLDSLGTAMRDRSDRVRLNAIYAAGVLASGPAPPAIVLALTGALTHADAEIRLAAARVLGRLRVHGAGDELVLAMNDPARAVRRAAIDAIGEIRAERALQALADQIAHYETGEDAAAALQALARIGHASSAPRFEGLIADGDPLIRRIAAEGIGRAGDPGRVLDLASRLDTESDPSVRLAMAFALARQEHQYLDQVISGLAASGTSDLARRYLTELASSDTRKLHPFLESSSPRIRAELAALLGLVGSQLDLAPLLRLARDPERAVVTAAELAVQRIQSRHS